MSTRTQTLSTGSSPLTRGKRRRPGQVRRPGGLIPAHAGKTEAAPTWSCSARAHPRSRGENSTRTATRLLLSGSSPLTRGKRTRPAAAHTRTGLIPAHAGKTLEQFVGHFAHEAHPRSRGENVRPKPASAYLVGSSPLTRGKRVTGCNKLVTRGLIPAHAGKTAGPTKPPKTASAHPRSRGENRPWTARWARSWGSSPLTRGKQACNKSCNKTRGLIPAHAGKTTRTGEPVPSTTAHPRSRGENSRHVHVVAPLKGSSPLTRGKLPSRRSIASQDGLIPAHAGKTTAGTSPSRWQRAHPRSRGENRRFRRSYVMGFGSSPLTRGKQRADEEWPNEGRLIPAHAGKTSPGRRSHHGSRAHPRSRGENFSLVFRAF